MEDIAPALLEKLRAAFEKNMAADPRLPPLQKKLEDGTATYPDAAAYAEIVGEALAKAFRENLSAADLPDGRMYYNIASRVVQPLLERDHALVSGVAAQIQQALNLAAGLRLKAQTPAVNQDRVAGIINTLSSAEHYDDVAYLLDEPVITFSRTVVDEALKKNVDFQGRAGLRPRVIRQAAYKCCDWCQKLEGTYDYPNVPQDVYRRHERCRCRLIFDPGNRATKTIWG